MSNKFMLLIAASALASGMVFAAVNFVNTQKDPTIFKSSVTIEGREINKPQLVTVADFPADGGSVAATATLTPTSGVVLLTCNDTSGGCTMTLGESGAVSGQSLTIVNMSSNSASFADTSGVSETTGTITLGQYDSIRYVYASDRWVELGTSNN